MSLQARLDGIRPRLLRRLAKGAYYALTLQFFQRLRARREHQRALRLDVPALDRTLPAGRAWLPLAPARNRAEYEQEMARPEWRERERFERGLAERHRQDERFGFAGRSLPAGRAVEFLVDRQYGAEEQGDVVVPRWRERLVCPVTQLTSRQRAIVTLLCEHRASTRDIFMFEQVTPLFRYLEAAAPGWRITGCEWLGADVPPGEVRGGIRHEDCAALSLADASMDIVVSLDVFEHVPDPRQGFREKARVLRPGGVLLMTVPFFAERDATVQRARLANGKLEHLLPPEYHGNPIDPTGGSLVYHDFGWDLLPMMREAGFADAYAGLYWSAEYGHLGAPQIVFVATRR